MPITWEFLGDTMRNKKKIVHDPLQCMVWEIKTTSIEYQILPFLSFSVYYLSSWNTINVFQDIKKSHRLIYRIIESDQNRMSMTPEDLVKIQLEHKIEPHIQCSFPLKEMLVVSIKGKELIQFRIFFLPLKIFYCCQIAQCFPINHCINILVFILIMNISES